MKIFKQIALICFFCLLGEVISWLLTLILPSFYIPGSLIGMILLFISLYLKLIKIDDIETVGSFFVNNMSFFFIPGAVSVMEYLDIINTSLWEILLVCFISFFITFSMIALSVQLTLLIQEKKLKKEEKNHEGNIR